MTATESVFRLTSPPCPTVSFPADSWQAKLVAEIERTSRAAGVGVGSISVISVMVGAGPVRWVVGHSTSRPAR